LNSSGLQGFFYADIGTNVKFTSDKNNEKIEKEYIIKDSKTIEQYLLHFVNKEEKLEWIRRATFKNNKYLLLSIISQYLKEINSNIESND
jgi:hypothetical protein